MAAFIEFEIISPTQARKVVVEWIAVVGEAGSFLIGPEHKGLVSILKPKSDLIYKTASGEEVKVDIFGGILEAAGDVVKIILDY